MQNVLTLLSGLLSTFSFIKCIIWLLLCFIVLPVTISNAAFVKNKKIHFS